MKKKRKEAGRRIAVLVIAAAMFLYSGYRVAAYLLEGRKSQDVTAELIQQAVRTPQPQETKGQPVHTLRPTPDAAEHVPDADDETADEQETTHTAPDELLSVDFDTLQSVNPDIQAWLYMSGSSIHYPVLQAEDNSTYLYRLADGSANAHGSLFIDCRNAGDFSDWNTLIYGHNMKDGSMFGGLKKYRKQAYYDAHPEMTLFTPEKTYRMEIFAAVTTDVSAAVYRVPAAREERDELVQWAQRNSEIECDVSIGTEDRIVTLSTCTGGDDDRFVVLAVLRET